VRITPLILLAATMLLGACDSQQVRNDSASAAPQAAPAPDAGSAGKLDRSHAGTAAPSSPFEDPNGDEVSLADFAGKPLLLNLWATWCAPCVTEMPTLDALARREGKRLNVLALSQDREGAAKVGPFFAKHGFKTLEPYLDPKSDMLFAAQADTLPTTIYYDARGKEVWRIVGTEDWTGPKAAGLLKEAGI
jgi:thiol-disulfide isomerase/thioredoxin